MILISLLNIFLIPQMNVYTPFLIIAMVCISTVFEIAIQGLLAFITHSFKDKYYSPEHKLYQVGKKERKFYEKIGIKHWKDKVWDLGALGGFRKNKIKNPNDSEYLYRFIIESNKGMLGHILGICFGFLNFVILPFNCALTISLPVAIVGFVLGLLPIFVLRYNLPKLTIAYERAKRLEVRQKNQSDIVSD